MKSSVIHRVIPCKPALVTCVLPKCLHEPDGFHRCLRAQYDSPARFIHFGSSKCPQKRVCPSRRVAECVTESLTIWPPALLQDRAYPSKLVQCGREAFGASIAKPRLPICHYVRNDAVRRSEPAAVHLEGRSTR